MFTSERWVPAVTVAIELLASARAFSQAADPAVSNQPPAAQMPRGKLLYFQHCVICHQSGGLGSPGVFPPLAQSDFLLANKKRTILALVQGLDGSIQVNGKSYDGAMPPAMLDDAK